MALKTLTLFIVHCYSQKIIALGKTSCFAVGCQVILMDDQRVPYEGWFSTSYALNTGVPQRSDRGPLFFNFCFSMVWKIVLQHSEVLQFVDVVKVIPKFMQLLTAR